MAQRIYDPDFHPQKAESHCAETGATPTQLAEVFGLKPNTIFTWISRYPEFSSAMDRGLTTFRMNVAERGLAKRMMGYTQTTTTYKYDENGNRFIAKEVEKDLPPDTEAIKFFLVNRAPKIWTRDGSGMDDNPVKRIVDEILELNDRKRGQAQDRDERNRPTQQMLS